MTVSPIDKLALGFANQAEVTWDRLGYIKETISSRGVLGQVRFGEETITDLMLLDLYLQGSTVALFEQTSRPDESMWGTDFELWLGSDKLGWFRFAIQAKKLNLRTDRYSSLTQKNMNGKQIDLLERYAQRNRAAPLYCLYNFSEDANELQHWHCCNGLPNLRELGCTVTPSSNIREAICKPGTKNFGFIHLKSNTLPWRCLVACPRVWQSLLTMSEQGNLAMPAAMPPIFEPSSCYHARLPLVLRRDGGGEIVRESENGGLLVSLRVNEDHELADSSDKVNPAVRGEFRERYNPEARVPKSAAVIEVQTPT